MLTDALLAPCQGNKELKIMPPKYTFCWCLKQQVTHSINPKISLDNSVTVWPHKEPHLTKVLAKNLFRPFHPSFNNLYIKQIQAQPSKKHSTHISPITHQSHLGSPILLRTVYEGCFTGRRNLWRACRGCHRISGHDKKAKPLPMAGFR